MTDALKDLLAKVEAGDFPADDDAPEELFSADAARAFWAAYRGALDAAKALHEAVLPGWRWRLSSEGFAVVVESLPIKVRRGDCHGNPARAWLIAILKALIAEKSNDL